MVANVSKTVKVKPVKAVRNKVERNIVLSKTGIEVKECYCRKCRETKKPSEFYQATRLNIDTNGYFSICKKCCGEIYVSFYKMERNFEKAILKTCRLLDVKYDPEAISAALIQMDTQKRNADEDTIFGVYKACLIRVQKSFDGKDSNADFSFYEPIGVIYNQDLEDEEFENSDHVKNFWGDGLTESDYAFLEEELEKWKKNYSYETHGEEIILRDLSFLEWEKRKVRNGSGEGSIVSIQKSIQDLMKLGNLSPAQAKASDSSKSQDAFGVWIKDIETTNPAERFADHSMFYDVDNAEEYIEKYFVRSAGKLILSSPDFQNEKVAELDDSNYDNSNLE